MTGRFRGGLLAVLAYSALCAACLDPSPDPWPSQDDDAPPAAPAAQAPSEAPAVTAPPPAQPLAPTDATPAMENDADDNRFDRGLAERGAPPDAGSPDAGAFASVGGSASSGAGAPALRP